MDSGPIFQVKPRFECGIWGKEEMKPSLFSPPSPSKFEERRCEVVSESEKVNLFGKGSRHFGHIKGWLDIRGHYVEVSSISVVLWFSSAMLKLFRGKLRVRWWLGFCQASLVGVLRVCKVIWCWSIESNLRKEVRTYGEELLNNETMVELKTLKVSLWLESWSSIFCSATAYV